MRPLEELDRSYSVTAVDFSPDGKWLLVGSASLRGQGRAQLFNGDGKAQRPIPQKYAVRAVAFSPHACGSFS